MDSDPVRWETVPCPLCGAADDRDLVWAAGDGGRCRVAECGRCGMAYLNPRPTADSIGRFYPPEYAPYQPPRRRGRPLARVRDRLRLGERRLSDRIPVRPGGVLLDYGCGAGWFAARMRDRGWDAVGMDVSPHAVWAARRHFGLRAVHGTLPHPAVPAGSVDAVTLRAVLEHVHDPRGLAAAVFDALRPGGWAYVSVPNLASWGFRTFGPDWSQLDLPRHLLHFTPATLSRLLTDAGFRVEATATRGHSKWMRASVARAAGRGWRAVSRLPLAVSGLTAWTGWAGRGDELCVLARKPGAAEAVVRRAA